MKEKARRDSERASLALMSKNAALGKNKSAADMESSDNGSGVVEGDDDELNSENVADDEISK